MNLDLFWYFVTRNEQQRLEIVAVCRHCLSQYFMSWQTGIDSFEQQLGQHQCTRTPLSIPHTMEIQK